MMVFPELLIHFWDCIVRWASRAVGQLANSYLLLRMLKFGLKRGSVHCFCMLVVEDHSRNTLFS